MHPGPPLDGRAGSRLPVHAKVRINPGQGDQIRYRFQVLAGREIAVFAVGTCLPAARASNPDGLNRESRVEPSLDRSVDPAALFPRRSPVDIARVHVGLRQPSRSLSHPSFHLVNGQNCGRRQGQAQSQHAGYPLHRCGSVNGQVFHWLTIGWPPVNSHPLSGGSYHLMRRSGSKGVFNIEEIVHRRSWHRLATERRSRRGKSRVKETVRLQSNMTEYRGCIATVGSAANCYRSITITNCICNSLAGEVSRLSRSFPE